MQCYFYKLDNWLLKLLHPSTDSITSINTHLAVLGQNRDKKKRSVPSVWSHFKGPVCKNLWHSLMRVKTATQEHFSMYTDDRYGSVSSKWDHGSGKWQFSILQKQTMQWRAKCQENDVTAVFQILTTLIGDMFWWHWHVYEQWLIFTSEIVSVGVSGCLEFLKASAGLLEDHSGIC